MVYLFRAYESLYACRSSFQYAPLSQENNLLLMGSCFASEMGKGWRMPSSVVTSILMVCFIIRFPFCGIA